MAVLACVYPEFVKLAHKTRQGIHISTTGVPSPSPTPSILIIDLFVGAAYDLLAGGGLGGNPRVGIKIEDFIKAEEVFEVAEAIKRLFDKHGDRSNKHKARLRYVLDRVGADEFINHYHFIVLVFCLIEELAFRAYGRACDECDIMASGV